MYSKYFDKYGPFKETKEKQRKLQVERIRFFCCCFCGDKFLKEEKKTTVLFDIRDRVCGICHPL